MLSPPSPGSCLFNEPADVPDNLPTLAGVCQTAVCVLPERSDRSRNQFYWLPAPRRALPFTDVMQKTHSRGKSASLWGGNRPERARSREEPPLHTMATRPSASGPVLVSRLEPFQRLYLPLSIHLYHTFVVRSSPPAPNGIRSGATPSIRR